MLYFVKTGKEPFGSSKLDAVTTTGERRSCYKRREMK
jgi:hypothetical protein